MARRIVVEDDLTGEIGAEAVTIGRNGKWYSVDLTKEGEDELDATLEPWLSRATEIKSTSPQQRPRQPQPQPTSESARRHDTDYLDDLREWAAGLGIEMRPRHEGGRIPADILDAFADKDVSKLKPGRLQTTRRQQLMLEERAAG